MTNFFTRLSFTVAVSMLLGVVICVPLEKKREVRWEDENKKDEGKSGHDDNDIDDWENTFDVPNFGGEEGDNQGLGWIPGGNLGVANPESFGNQYLNPEDPFASFGSSQNSFGYNNQGYNWESIWPYLLNFGTGNQGSSFGSVENWSATDIQQFLAYFFNQNGESNNQWLNQGSWPGQSIGWPATGGAQSRPEGVSQWNGWTGNGVGLPGQWNGWSGTTGRFNPGQRGGYNPGRKGGYNRGQNGGYNPDQVGWK